MSKPRIVGGLFGSQAAVKEAMDRKGGGGSSTWRVPPDGSLTVRFLTEPDQWAEFYEVYDQATRTYKPLVEGEDVPSDQRKSYRILASVLMRDEDRGDRVVPLKMPKDLANRVNQRFARYGTLLDRDYVLSRFGKDLSTTYEVEAEAPSSVKVDKYDLPDLLEVLENELALAEGREPVRGVDTDDDEEEDEVEADEVEAEEDDDEDEVESDEEGEEIEYEAVERMSIVALKSWAEDLGVDVPAGIKKQELVDLVWESLG